MDKVRKDQDFRDLCDYVKASILEYSDDMKLPRFIILRLRGLEKGQFLANKKCEPYAKYDCKTILYTFKSCKLEISRGIKGKDFKNEQHRFNYIMVIIESNINDMVNRLNNVQKSKEKTESIALDHVESNSAEYKPKSKNVNIKELDTLW